MNERIVTGVVVDAGHGGYWKIQNKKWLQMIINTMI